MPAQFAAVLCLACFVIGLVSGYEMAFGIANARVERATRVLERVATFLQKADEEVQKQKEPKP